MRTNFRFSNMCGTVYNQGNLVYSPDGNILFSPVGNKVNMFDLVKNRSSTLPIQTRWDVAVLALAPRGNLLLIIDERGFGALINLYRRVLLKRMVFHGPVAAAEFSPDGKLLATTHDGKARIWKTPGIEREFSSMTLWCETTSHHDDITTLTWSADSRYLLTGSKDMSVKVHEVRDYHERRVKLVPHRTLIGHASPLVAVFVAPDSKAIYSVSRDGTLLVRHAVDKSDSTSDNDDEGMDQLLPRAIDGALALGEEDSDHKINQFRITARHYFHQSSAQVTAATFFAPTQMLVVGYSNGVFEMWELPHFVNLQRLSVSNTAISTLAINQTGEWIGLGCAKLHQLLVWEWQSESYVLKQQGHFYDMNGVSHSPDGQYIATCGDDGKVKLWNAVSGFCFVTFSDHVGPASAVTFTKNGQVVVSASLDGTVRAYDLIRYRNFRTFTTPEPTQLSTLAVDPSGEFVCAASPDNFDIYVWSMQTGKLLDVLTGHSAPISKLAFRPDGMMVASASWDATVRLWSFMGRKKETEVLEHRRVVLALAFHPNGEQLAASTVDGDVCFWDIKELNQTGSIEGHRDVIVGQRLGMSQSTANAVNSKAFKTMSYSPDGSTLLCGGDSPVVLLYDTQTYVLVRAFKITRNRKFDGIDNGLPYRNMTEAGHIDEIDDYSDESDLDSRKDTSLPGVKKGDLAKRSTPRQVRARAVEFSPTGRAWAAATTDGLMIYSLDNEWNFDPFDLDAEITPATVMDTLQTRDYLVALVMALRLNEAPLIRQVYEAVPPVEIPLLAQGFPSRYVDRLLMFIATHSDTSPHVEFHLMWVNQLLIQHGPYLKRNIHQLQPTLRNVQKSLRRVQGDLSKLCNENAYTLQFLLNRCRQARQKHEATTMKLLNEHLDPDWNEVVGMPEPNL
ncbi:U3 snoRNP protein [Dimargaris xerosporica]|nr:U3 snoRNP protein [Dimargaris xerosporica]